MYDKFRVMQSVFSEVIVVIVIIMIVVIVYKIYQYQLSLIILFHYQMIREFDSWLKLSLTPHTLRIVKAVQKHKNDH